MMIRRTMKGLLSAFIIVAVLLLNIIIIFNINTVEGSSEYSNVNSLIRATDDNDIDRKITVLNETCYGDCLYDCCMRYSCHPKLLRQCFEFCGIICCYEIFEPPLTVASSLLENQHHWRC